ncbi:MAG TPA: hypothetical protein VKV79_01035, partial [Terriglobia bacterium]|nr:hypothetical protein [Terriglobia bacterium]
MRTSRPSGIKSKAFGGKLARIAWLSLLCFPFCLAAQSAQTAPPAPNRLITARIAYVAHMPDNLDQWLI